MHNSLELQQTLINQLQFLKIEKRMDTFKINQNAMHYIPSTSILNVLVYFEVIIFVLTAGMRHIHNHGRRQDFCGGGAYFSKIFKKILKKIAKMHTLSIFSKDLKN